MVGRSTIPEMHRVQVLVFRFDKRDTTEIGVARYLARAPKGKRRGRARELIISGYREHLAEQGIPAANTLGSAPQRPSIPIDGIYFDSHDPLQVQCATYLKRVPWRTRREKMIKLMLAGFRTLQAATSPHADQGTET